MMQRKRYVSPLPNLKLLLHNFKKLIEIEIFYPITMPRKIIIFDKMNKMNKMNIRKRIFLNHLIPAIIFLLLIMGNGIVYLSSSHSLQLNEKTRITQDTTLAANNMLLRVAFMGRQVRGYLLVGNDDGDFQRYEKERNNYLDAKKELETLIKKDPDFAEKEKFSNLVDLENQFEELAQRTFHLRDEGKLKEAINTYLKESKNNLGKFEITNQEFNQIEQGLLRTLNEETQGSIRLINFSSLALTALALVEAYLLSNLVKSLNLFINIAEAGKELEVTMTEQVSSTNEVAVTSKEIAANSKYLMNTIEEVKQTSQVTANAAGDSQNDLIQMEKTMQMLAIATSSISAKLGTISEKASRISSIITTITKVADQTNLLSLNAAIEAEKAGQYGAGFAVVAREIRRLADQTAVATLDIENMVKEMQGSVSTGVMEMDKFTKNVEVGVEDVRKIGMKLEAIIGQVQTLTPRFEQVSNNMEGQAQGAEQISEAMAQLTEVSLQTSQSLREINLSLRQLDS